MMYKGMAIPDRLVMGLQQNKMEQQTWHDQMKSDSVGQTNAKLLSAVI